MKDHILLSSPQSRKLRKTDGRCLPRLNSMINHPHQEEFFVLFI